MTDTAGNEAEVTVEFPAVSKGDLTLTGFGYSAESARVGQTAPAVTAPTVAPAGVSPTLSYAASPAAVCTVDAGTGALTLLGAGECEITVTAAATANYNGATDTATVTVEAALRLIVNVDTIAVDDVVNAAEKAAGFAIAGDTAGQEGVTVAVEIGSGSLTASSDSSGAWSVDVPPASSYISEPSVTVTVNAAKTGFTAAAAVERTVRVDLTAPSASYTAPSSLKVGVAMTSISPTTSATDVESYAAAGLPGGLEIDGGTGAIGGTPTTAAAAASTVTVTVTDTAGNEAEVTVEFPAVSKGDLTLTGFGYSAESARVGQTAPAVTAPTVAPAGCLRR